MSDILELVTSSQKNLFIGLAGPGTGKSFTFKTLAQSKDFQGKKILVLSFINKLVDDLKDDFAEYTNIEVSTLHSFAMQEYVKKVNKDIELDEDLDSVISQDRFDLFDQTMDYQKSFHDLTLSKEDEEFFRSRSTFYANKEAVHSFNSVIYAIAQLFESDIESIPKYDLILVDEFQDFNKLEWKFISQLNKKSKVILVGDDDQSLYSWKNAQPQLIRNLYSDSSNEGFSLDYCYRCTRVIVDAVNSLIAGSNKDGLLMDRVSDKKYIYPSGRKEKDAISSLHNKIDFIPAVSGSQLIYMLAARIKKDTKSTKEKRVLVLAPSFFKQQMYEGLVRQGLNVVEFELFRDEKHKTIKHRHIIESFKTLELRKTDNLAIRRLLYLYMDADSQKDLVNQAEKEGKKLWSCLDQSQKQLIEDDIALFKLVRQAKEPVSADGLVRLNEIFNLKNVLSKMINKFEPHTRNGLEVELTTVMSSKGLSADFVYYIGVDDSITFDRETKSLSNQGVCEFLVGITRAKEKLTITTFRDSNPKLLSYITDHLNKVAVRR